MHDFRGKSKKEGRDAVSKLSGEGEKEKWRRQTWGPERRTRKIRGLRASLPGSKPSPSPTIPKSQ